MNATSGTVPLTRHDRCDRCSAAAMLRAVLVTGGVLLFCGHHARAHGPRLHQLGARLSIELSPSHSWTRPDTPADPAAGTAPSWVSHPG